MKIPLRIRLFDRFVKFPKYIIIHDINCLASSEPKVRIDNEFAQANYLRTYEYQKHMLPDLNYHFILETIKQDYEVILGRPLAVHCEYDDIKSPYDFAFHVCIMGNLNLDIPDPRLYKKLCYNVLSPLMNLFKINSSRILLHSEVSKDDAACPGSFFDKKRMLSQLQSMRLV